MNWPSAAFPGWWQMAEVCEESEGRGAGGQAVEKLPAGQIGNLLEQLGLGLSSLLAADTAQLHAPTASLLVVQCLAALPLSSSTALPASAAVRALLQLHLAQPLALELRKSKARALLGQVKSEEAGGRGVWVGCWPSAFQVCCQSHFAQAAPATW